MNFEEVCHLVDAALSHQTGKHLSDLQKMILQRSWSGEKYPAIAQVAFCTHGHVRDVAAELWQQLSDGKINLFRNHTLVKAQKKDCVRETQVRLIVQPAI